MLSEPHQLTTSPPITKRFSSSEAIRNGTIAAGSISSVGAGSSIPSPSSQTQRQSHPNSPSRMSINENGVVVTENGELDVARCEGYGKCMPTAFDFNHDTI